MILFFIYKFLREECKFKYTLAWTEEHLSSVCKNKPQSLKLKFYRPFVLYLFNFSILSLQGYRFMDSFTQIWQFNSQPLPVTGSVKQVLVSVYLFSDTLMLCFYDSQAIGIKWENVRVVRSINKCKQITYLPCYSQII